MLLIFDEGTCASAADVVIVVASLGVLSCSRRLHIADDASCATGLPSLRSFGSLAKNEGIHTKLFSAAAVVDRTSDPSSLLTAYADLPSVTASCFTSEDVVAELFCLSQSRLADGLDVICLSVVMTGSSAPSAAGAAVLALMGETRRKSWESSVLLE